MFSISSILANMKYIFYAFIVLLIVGVYYFYHYLPISDLQEDVKQLKFEVFTKDTKINNLHLEIIKCKDDQKVKEFESYFEGLANEESDINNSVVFPTYSF